MLTLVNFDALQLISDRTCAERELSRLLKRLQHFEKRLKLLETYRISMFGELLTVLAPGGCVHGSPADLLKIARGLSEGKKRRSHRAVVLVRKCSDSKCTNPDHVMFGSHSDRNKLSNIRANPDKDVRPEIEALRTEIPRLNEAVAYLRRTFQCA